jgi:hypothetical protein
LPDIDSIGAMLSCTVLWCRVLTACATVEQEKRLRAEVEHLEEDTGIKLRVLCQNYPQTPGKPWFVCRHCLQPDTIWVTTICGRSCGVHAGLAIKDFWGVDANTIVFVAVRKAF